MTFISFVFPPLLGYFAVAMLAVTPRTHTLRMVLWPATTLFALRAAVSVDMSPGEPDQISGNILYIVSMFFIIARTFEWTLMKEPLVRRLHPANCSSSTIMDTLDLSMSLRGRDWDWSCGVFTPPETRPTNRVRFIFHVTLSTAFHALICGIFHCAIRSFSPTGLGASTGGSIFDETLPFYVRYPRACVISAFASVAIYAAIQTCYDACTIVGVLVFLQVPARWPPAFHAPWCATSLADFWGRRWHQFFRRTFLVLGGYPLSFFLGMPGLVIGSFLASGFLHLIVMGLFNDQFEPWRMLIGFGMMGPVILAERALKWWTGRKVGGVAGWVWTMVWLLVWGHMIVEAFARGGVFGHFTVIERVVPGRGAVQHLVATLDAWFHTMAR